MAKNFPKNLLLHTIQSLDLNTLKNNETRQNRTHTDQGSHKVTATHEQAANNSSNNESQS